jgi:hypothetical protein
VSEEDVPVEDIEESDQEVDQDDDEIIEEEEEVDEEALQVIMLCMTNVLFQNKLVFFPEQT